MRASSRLARIAPNRPSKTPHTVPLGLQLILTSLVDSERMPSCLIDPVKQKAIYRAALRVLGDIGSELAGCAIQQHIEDTANAVASDINVAPEDQEAARTMQTLCDAGFAVGVATCWLAMSNLNGGGR